MDLEDPFNWDIDRIVRELCTEPRKWKVNTASRRMPDPVKFEEALRAQEINGFALLTSVTEEVLRDELGLQVFGQRATVSQFIKDLRLLSAQYEVWVNTFGSELSLAAHRVIAESSIKKRPRSLAPGTVKAGGGGSTIGTTGPTGACISDGNEKKRRKLEGITSDLVPIVHNVSDLDGAGQVSVISNAETIVALEDNRAGKDVNHREFTEAENLAVGDTGLGEGSLPKKKVKRLEPTLISPVVLTSRGCNILPQADVAMSCGPHIAEPGVIYKSQDGKKRLMLPTLSDDNFTLPQPHQQKISNGYERKKDILQLGGHAGLQAAHRILRVPDSKGERGSSDNLSDGYLGNKMYGVDEVFYPSNPMGNELSLIDDEKAFSQVTDSISSGRRLYIHNLMKHYLRSRWQTVHRGKEALFARIPYASRLALLHHARSFTLIKVKNEAFCATRENLLKWPEIDPNPTIETNEMLSHDDERRAQFDLPNSLPLGGPSSYDNWEPDLLQKYRYINGGDIVLPLYGESDEEGEYDIETWHEIEEEQGELEKPLLAIKKRPLTKEEVNAAIDEAIAQILVKWNTEKLPKRQFRAWSLWRKSRRQDTKRRLIQEAQQHVDRINNERLPQMREKILEEIWTSQKQVRWQTKVMEQSIFDREDLTWQISVIKMAQKPEKPLVPVVPRRKERRISDGDGENIETTDAEDSYDELDDFVVDDDMENFSGKGGNLRADDEAEDSIVDFPMSDGASSDEASQSRPFDLRRESSLVSDLDIRESLEGYSHMPNSVAFSESERSSKTDFKNSAWSRSSPLSLTKAQVELPLVKREEQSVQGLISEVIDLTQLTSEASGPENWPSPSPVINLVTPAKRRNNLRLTYKGKGSIIPENLFTSRILDNEDSIVPQKSLSYQDLIAIGKMSRKELEEASDREGLVIWVLYKMSSDPQAKLFNYFQGVQAFQMWPCLVKVMYSLRDNFDNVKGMDPQLYTTSTGVIQLFQIYVDRRMYNRRPKLSAEAVEKLENNKSDFKKFHKVCRDALSTLFAGDPSSDSEPVVISTRKPNLVFLSDSDTDEEPRHILQSSRKKKFHEDLQARDLREQDQQRVQEQNKRRQILQQRLALSGGANADRSGIIINDAKLDHEGFVYVHEEVKKRIKDHQVEGIRFMWNQIVTNKNRRGCLLAHTMGLGKTMQVITLLVAIAEAAQSSEESISSQIPESLRHSHTLVLCPAGLIDNWVDEFLTWTPLNGRAEFALGQCLKIDATMPLEVRLQVIDGWYRSSGVLIIGYEMFRWLIHNQIGEKRPAPLSAKAHQRVLEQLLDGPNIIIADEAHKMKNSTSSITIAASKFTSKTRIALTGSPLANNIEEYHAMIEWIAPNYLGPIAEFRAKYVEPIEGGLWMDSSASERRRSLKWLGVLNENLAPKVHRADMSVLRGDLKPKTEFALTIPLTIIQRKAYSLYVRSMLGMDNDLTKTGQLHTGTLWHWLAVLSLLCNHPECFRKKLQESWDDAAHGLLEVKPYEDDMPVWKAGVSEDLVHQEMDLFRKFGSPIDAIENSNKAKLLEIILDASKAAGDKVLVFSHSIPTLDFLEHICKRKGRLYARLDGSTKIETRQASSKEFNSSNTELFLISTTAGGLGLNLPGANRVVIFDFKFNPINEEQAIGRAYRIGQQKPVFVYKFVVGGTFEECIHNRAIFKIQLASRVVDKKNPVASAKKNIGEFLFEPKEVEQQDLSSFRGKDPHVLDKLLDFQESSICNIVITDSFQRDENDELTPEEQKEVRQLVNDEQLKRTDLESWRRLMKSRKQDLVAKAASAANARATQDHDALVWSDDNQEESAKKFSHFQPSRNFNGSSMPLPTRQAAIPHSSPKAMLDMPPIAATNTKIYSPAHSTSSRISDFSKAKYSHHEGAISQSNSRLNNRDISQQATNLSLQNDVVGVHYGTIARKSTTDSPKSYHHRNGSTPGPSMPVASGNNERFFRAVVRQAISKNKNLGNKDEFSEQQVEEAAVSLRTTINQKAPERSKEIAERLTNDFSLVIQLLLGQLRTNDLIDLILSQSAEPKVLRQAFLPGVPPIIPKPKQPHESENFVEASREAVSANLLQNNTRQTLFRPKSIVNPQSSSSATKHQLVPETNRNTFAQKFEKAMKTTVATHGFDISAFLGSYSFDFYTEIAKTASFEIARGVGGMSHFEIATATAIKEISKIEVLSGIMSAPGTINNFAKEMVLESRDSKFALTASPDIRPKHPNLTSSSILPPSRSRYSLPDNFHSQITNGDIEYLKKLAKWRSSKASNMVKQQRQDKSPKLTQPRDPKLPSWAMSKIEAANT